MSNKLPKRDVLLIVFLGIYCLSVAGFAMSYFLVMYDGLAPQIGSSESTLMKLIVAVGVIAGVTRGAAELVSDVGDAKFKRTVRRSLSYLMRPVEGGAMAIIAYFVFRGGLLVFQQGWPTINPWGFFAMAGLAGLLAPRLVDRFRHGVSRAVSPSDTLTPDHINQVLEHMLEQVKRSGATDEQKEEAKRRLRDFLQQPLVATLFGAALDDLNGLDEAFPPIMPLPENNSSEQSSSTKIKRVPNKVADAGRP